MSMYKRRTLTNYEILGFLCSFNNFKESFRDMDVVTYLIRLSLIISEIRTFFSVLHEPVLSLNHHLLDSKHIPRINLNHLI